MEKVASADTTDKVHGAKSKASKLASRHHRRKRRREQRVEDLAPPYPTYSQPDVETRSDIATTTNDGRTKKDQEISSSVPPCSRDEHAGDSMVEGNTKIDNPCEGVNGGAKPSPHVASVDPAGLDNELRPQSSEGSMVNHPNSDSNLKSDDSLEERKERLTFGIVRAPPAIALEQQTQGGHLPLSGITCKKVCEAGDHPNENRGRRNGEGVDTEKRKFESSPITKTTAGDIRRQQAARVQVKKVGMDIIEIDCSEDDERNEEPLLKASRKSRIVEKKASNKNKKANGRARKRPKPARVAKEPSDIAGNRCKDETEQGGKRTKSEIGAKTQAKLAPGDKNRCHACLTCDCCNRDSTAKTPPPATRGTSSDFCSDARVEQSLLNRINKHNRHIDWCVSTRDKTYRDLKRHRREIQKKKGSGASSIVEGAPRDRFLADAESTDDLGSKVSRAIGFAEIKRASRVIFGGKPKSKCKSWYIHAHWLRRCNN